MTLTIDYAHDARPDERSYASVGSPREDLADIYARMAADPLWRQDVADYQETAAPARTELLERVDANC